MASEGEFARHYVITDARYLNLGACPVKSPDAITMWMIAARIAADAPALRV